MRSPTKQTDRRKTERRSETAGRELTTAGAPRAERRVVEQRGVATSMVDALEDILKWERASERAMRIAKASSPTKLDPSN